MERFDPLKWKCLLLVTEKKPNLSVPMALMKEVKIVIPKLDIVSPVCYVLQPAENDTSVSRSVSIAAFFVNYLTFFLFSLNVGEGAASHSHFQVVIFE